MLLPSFIHCKNATNLSSTKIEIRIKLMNHCPEIPDCHEPNIVRLQEDENGHQAEKRVEDDIPGDADAAFPLVLCVI